MFERIAVDFLNKFFGDYFENLDTSNLDVSLWKGDVALTDIFIKSTALDTLKMPFKVVSGKVGKLTMSIPWKTIYTSPVVLTLKDLYLVTVPSPPLPYDVVAEQQAIFAQKMKQLDEMEVRRRSIELRESGEVTVTEGDSYKEKLMMHMIRNVQIRIESIHVRYEDKITSPANPFSIGIVLKSLNVQTTDATWTPNFITIPTPTIHKIVNMIGLGLYLNSGEGNMMSQKIYTKEKMLAILKTMVTAENVLKYMVGPIMTELKIQLTPSPEISNPPFILPKINVEMIMDELALGISNVQFHDILHFADGINSLTQARKWKNFRPNLTSYKGNARVWWKFSYACILVEIRCRRHNWKWSKIKSHRVLYKAYYDACYKKNIQKNISPQLDEQIKRYEKELDNFNIVLVRKQIEMKKERQDKINNERRHPGGWMGNLFGFDNIGENLEEVVGRLDDNWNADEKKKLDLAMGYNSNILQLNYPKDYVEFKLDFCLKKLNVIVKEIHPGPTPVYSIILRLKLDNFINILHYRPVNNGLKIVWKMGNIEIFGISNANKISTCILKAKKEMNEHFFEICYEKIPLDSLAEKRIRLRAKALEVVYHAKTTSQLLKSFTPPSEIIFSSRIQADAMSKLNEFKDVSSASLKRMVHTKGELIIEVDLMAPYFIIPQNGDLDQEGTVLIIDLGELQVRTQSHEVQKPKVTQTQTASETLTDENGLTPEFLQLYYETYFVHLKDFRVLLALRGEDYKLALLNKAKIDGKEKMMHLLRLKELLLTVNESLLVSNPSAPKFIAKVSLPLIDFEITEDRLVQLVRLLISLPVSRTHYDNNISTNVYDSEYKQALTLSEITPMTDEIDFNSGSVVQFTELILEIRLQVAKIRVSRPKGLNGELKPLLDFELKRNTTKLCYKSFVTTIEFKIGGISLCAPSDNFGLLYLLQTPMTLGSEKPLLNIQISAVTPGCPKAMQNPIKLHLITEVSSLDIILHEEVLLALFSFVDGIISQLSKDFENFIGLIYSAPTTQESVVVASRAVAKGVTNPKNEKQNLKKYKGNPSDVIVKIDAQMQSLTIQLSSEKKNILKMAFVKLKFLFQQIPNQFDFKIELLNVNCLNLDSNSSYKTILSVEGDKILFVHVTVYKREEKEGWNSTQPNVRITAQTGSPNFVCIGSCLGDVIKFASHFNSVTKAIKEASAAAEANMKQVYTNDMKILLDIQIGAPRIILPRTVNSPSALMVDLGNLSFQNTFRLVDAGKTKKALIDEMSIHLKSLKLSRIIVDLETQSIKAESLLLQPVSFLGNVRRNLSADWYTYIPAFNFVGKLDSTILRISNDDYEMALMALLNFLAGFDDYKVHKKARSNKVNKDILTGSETTVLDMNALKNDPLSISIKLTFDEFGIVLFQGALKMNEDTLPNSKQFACLAKFSIVNTQISFEMWNKYKSDFHISVRTIGFTDCRETAGAYSNLILRKTVTDEPVLKFSMKFSLKTGGEKLCQVDFIIQNLKLVICLDYLAQVIGFFLSASYSIMPNLKAGGARAQLRKLSDSLTNSIKMLRKDSVILNFNSGELEVVLVEDMNTIHTNAIIFNFQTILEISCFSQEAYGTVRSNLLIKTCNYSPAHRNATLAEVFSPTEMTIILFKSKTSAWSIEVDIYDIYIRLSAGTVELFAKISQSWNYASVIAEKEARREIDNSNIWDTRSIENEEFWFLSPDGADRYMRMAVSNTSTSSTYSTTEIEENMSTLSEHLTVKPVSIIITFEVGVDLATTPLLLIDTTIDLQAFNWFQKMILCGSLKFTMAYNNTKFGMWEYLVEPNEVGQYGTATHKPWEATYVISKSNAGTRHRTGESNISLPIHVSETEDQSKVYHIVSFQSTDILELTLTQSAFEVLKNLGDAFKDATKSLVSQRQVSTSPYVVVNDTGVEVKLDLHDTPFLFTKDDVFIPGIVNLTAGTKINLLLDIAKTRYSILHEQEGKIERRLKISIIEYQFESEIPINRAEGRFYPFEPESRNGLYCDVKVKDCSVIVTLRGIYNIVNHLDIPLNVYAMEVGETNIKKIGSVAKMNSWNVPIKGSKKLNEFFFAPEGYTPVGVPIAWLASNLNPVVSSTIICKPKFKNSSNVNIKVINEIKQVLLGNTIRRTPLSRVCNIHLRAPLVLINSLPTPMIFCPTSTFESTAEVTLEGGYLLLVTCLKQGDDGEFDFSVKVHHEGHFLTCHVNIKTSTPELSAWIFKDGDKNILNLGIHRDISDEVVTLQVYCPFWMINLTGLLLAYKGDENNSLIKLHPERHKGPLMFSSDGNDFFSKKKAALKCSTHGDWSEKLFLDVTGSSFLVTSKSPQKDFQIEGTISLSKFGLTKLVTFKPRFQVINRCSYHILLEETEFKDDKIHLDDNICLPFWPKSKTPMMAVSIYGTNEVSKSINYSQIQNILLKLKNMYGGIHVNVHVAETKTTITFSEYVVGQAPALLINATENISIDFSEVDKEENINLGPKKCQLFTWSEPAGQRSLTFSLSIPKSVKFKDNLLMDASGEFKTKISSGEEKEICWISFLEGFQRILLFTENKKLASTFINARVSELIQMELLLSLSGLGLSLVNSVTSSEIIYLRVSSAGIQWEISIEGFQHLYLPLDLDSCTLLETAYQNYIEAKRVSNLVDALFTMSSEFEINFEKMTTTKPVGRSLRRSPIQPGIWVDIKKLPLSTQIQVKVNRIQIDNQLRDCSFRTLLSPVPPPKTVVIESDSPKPFINMSLMQRSTAHNKGAPFIYCSILVQEFHVRFDMGFINEMIMLFKTSTSAKSDLIMKNFQKDYGMASNSSDYYFESQVYYSGDKHFFEKLHLSPIKVHLSYSVRGSEQDRGVFLSLLLQSIGVTLADAQDVVFKLACLELKHMYLTNDQLLDEIKSHYISQAMRQFYSFIFGLDFIGNPIRLVRGVTEGIQAFFYEPFQGAIQGPAEFAEGLSLGVKSLVGNTVGGAAGALSKITGSFGKGLAFLTMDETYQKKRQDVIAQRSREGIVSYARNFIMTGIVGTVTGVVTNPIKGAQTEGISGFGKGLLKGTLGLVARPITGAADLATSTLGALQRATQPKDVLTTQIRPPRNIEADTYIVPYVRSIAEGILIYKELKVGRSDLAQEDYVAHIVVGYSKNQVLLITTNRTFYLTLRDIFGASAIQWEHKWEDFVSLPDIIEHERGLSFHLKEKEKGFLRTLHSVKLFVPIPDAQICLWMLTKIDDTMRQHEKSTEI